jgi:hypothetical protein
MNGGSKTSEAMMEAAMGMRLVNVRMRMQKKRREVASGR